MTVPSARQRTALVRGSDAVAAGDLTVGQLRGPAWRRVVRDVYAPAELPLTHGVRIAAARLVMPSGALVAGRSAAWLMGAHEIIAADAPVEVLVAESARFGPMAGLRIRTSRHLDGERPSSGRTSPLRTASDLARWAPDVVEGVVRVDQLLRTHALGVEDLRAESLAASGRVRRTFALADPRAESPPESRLRVALVGGGLEPVPQFTVWHDGTFVARLDLAFPAARLGVEYDGGWHGEPGQFARDRQRLNRLLAAGWRVVHLTAADLRHPECAVAEVRRALRTSLRG